LLHAIELGLPPADIACADDTLILPYTCPGGAETRAAALHALATAAGAERAGGGGAAAAPRAAALAPRAEDALRGAVFRGAARAPGAPSPAEALLAALRQPDAELRVAAYRCEPRATAGLGSGLA